MRAVLFVFACVSFVAGQEQDINSAKDLPKYDQRYDYLNIDAILENKRLVRNYVDCLINAKPCTPEGKALKKLLPDALRTKCVRCTETQKQAAVKVIRRLKSDYPDEWQKLASRWDPTGDFTRYFEEVLTRDDINTIPNNNEILGSSSLPSLPPTRPSPPPPTPTLPPPSPATSSSQQTNTSMSTSPRPVILNRFGDDGEPVVNGQPAPEPSSRPTTARPAYTTRPTQTSWAGAASDVIPTRFYYIRPTKEVMPVYTTAITLIDQIGYKIIRTTELVADILKNTVRAVVG